MTDMENKILESLETFEEAGWVITVESAGVALSLIRFSRGDQSVMARLDTAKRWFIDAVPVTLPEEVLQKLINFVVVRSRVTLNG
jgi:hypothetical protein